MKVLMLLESDYPPDIRVQNETKVLVNEGYGVTLLCLTKQKQRVGTSEIDGVEVHRFYLPQFFYKSKVAQIKFPFYNWFWKSRVYSFLKTTNQKFDCIHVHDLTLLNTGLVIKKKLGVPLITDLHENYPYLIKNAKHTQKGLGKWLSDYKSWITYEQNNIGKSDYVLTVVEEMKNRLLQFDPRPERHFVYQNVVALSNIPETVCTDVESNEFKIVYAGGLTPQRGVQYVIEAIAVLNKRGVECKLVICGSGNYLEYLKKQVVNLNLQKEIEFKGHVSQEQVFREIEKGSATVIPHLRSIQNDCSSPNKLFQYMALGKPVFVSNCKSLARIVKEYECGLSYQFDDSTELANSVEKIINDKSLQLKMGVNALKAVKEKFNVDEEGKNITKLYEILASNVAR